MASQEDFRKTVGYKIKNYLKESINPICLIKITEQEVKHLKILGANLGFYPQLLIGRSFKANIL